MNLFPDFKNYGYQVIKELGRNREGGRITWQAKKLETNEEVVLKQFCFAIAGTNWSGFQTYEREIEVLQGLKHPGIPRYLESFETEDGFCLIQEYKNAPSLEKTRSFEPEEIKKIAIRLLEILVFLQNRIPPVIHRDIKPENILVDSDLNVYLIDFGFARIGSQEVFGSSVFKGTPGFIPPEQVRKPTEASDLYSLGATLICLLTGKKSTQIQELTAEDDPYYLEFKHLLPRLNLRFINWLEQMVQPKLKERFKNAEEALEALKPLYVIRIPEVKLSQSTFDLTATKLGEKLIIPLTINNSIPETVLEGKCEVVPHPSDITKPDADRTWISFNKQQFNSNLVNLKIKVDTSRLQAEKIYERQLVLIANSSPETQTINLKLRTAPLPIQNKKIPAIWLSLLLATSLLIPVEIELAKRTYVKVNEIVKQVWYYHPGF
ncbi:MAG: serine/threonine protein kinase [Hydrococcus sp. Prado102]|jgi:serine/threonine protein kinase|nr:serine/threonine protein kinase [Hydrococcus sp. Prado102]